MYNLVIIDVQTDFIDIVDNINVIFKNINRNILQANKDKANIIFIEFPTERNKPSLICKELDTSGKNVFIGKKQVMDASHQVDRIIIKHSLNRSYFKVCGLYVEACVLATVDGLSNKFKQSQIEVLKDCCNQQNAENAFKLMRQNKNVTVS